MANMTPTTRHPFAGLLIVAVTSATVWLASEVQADPAYIYGIHDPGGEWMMGSNKGWIVWTEAIGTSGSGGGNYSSYQNAGYGVIVRLNNGYGSSGTIPYESQYDAFAARCANYIQNSSGADYWIIGNETNLPREWPGNNNGDPNTGEPITSTRYVSCYNKCYTAIKNVAPEAKVCPSPSGTWAPPYPAQGIEGFLNYWLNCLNGIGASKIDGLILHAYTHGCDPALVTSEAKMNPPYENIYYNFRVYKNYMWNIPSGMTSKPVLITECDQNIECADGAYPRHTWYNVNNNWMEAAFAEINNWNQNNTQQIRCLAMFRWPMAQEGEWTFGLADRYNCQADFQDAVVYGYTWDDSGGPPIADFSATPRTGTAPLTVNFTDLSTGNINNWSWNFGDSGTSGAPSPVHEYQTPNTYTVSLTVTGPNGNDTETKINYITVLAPWYTGDIDRDDDVDQDDFGLFQVCLAGTGNSYPPECEDANLNGDSYIDQNDFAVFQACFTGPNQTPPPECLN